ncbi:hypothetical protein [Corticicoccus populi]|uniref:Uncharacterized protein n=1 Tax=Corticicoccus populi TaxID=1812821 RepID=A0ABW5WU76_9STAP
MNKTELNQMTEKLSNIQNTLEMQNHLFEFVPSVGGMEKDELLLAYHKLYCATDTIYEMNQKTNNVLESLINTLLKAEEELEDD